jgi:hypothetical protein
MAYNFETGENKINLFMEYENVTQKVLLSGRKYDVIPRNGNCSRESNVRPMVFLNEVRYQNATSLQN